MKLMETKFEVFAELAAREQLAATHNPNDETVQDSYAAFIRANRELFLRMPVDVVFKRTDTYNSSSKAMFADIIVNGNLDVFTGGSLPDNHPLAQRDYGLYCNLNANLVFRAVHDYYGHFLNRLGFGTRDEYVVAMQHARLLPSNALNALLCETVLQTSVYHLTGKYAEQKVFRVSDELISAWRDIKNYLPSSERERQRYV